MTAEEYLQQIQLIDIRITQRISEVEQLRQRITLIGGLDYSKDRVQMSPTTGNKQIETLVDMEAEVLEMIENESRLKHEIIEEIQSLGNSAYVDILYRRYVQFQSFEQIAYNLKYAYNYVATIHGEALKEFEGKVLN